MIRNKITSAFSTMITQTKVSPDSDENFKHQKHFVANVDLSAEQDFKDMFFDLIESMHKTKAGEFEFKDKDIQVLITPEEAREYTDGHVAGAFDLAKDAQAGKQPDEALEQEVEVEDTTLTEEEAYIKKLEKYADKIARGIGFDWQDLFPYFGFSGVPGMRQWYLKKVEPKIKIMTYTYDDPDSGEKKRSALNDLFDQNMVLLSKRMAEVIRSTTIPELEKKKTRGKLKQKVYDSKKNKLKEVDEDRMLRALKNNVLPVLDEINQEFDAGASYDDIANGTDFLKATVGGYVLRNLGSYPLDNLITEFSERWAEDIKSVINQIRAQYNPGAGDNLSESELDKLVEYWTGLKGDPDFANKNKAAKALIKGGITPEAYIDIGINAQNAWEDLEYETDETQPGADLSEHFMDQIDALIEKGNEKAMNAAIKKAYKEMMQELGDAGRQRQAGM